MDTALTGFTSAYVTRLDADFICKIAPAQSGVKPELRQLCGECNIDRR
nr:MULTISPECIES: hypothetical protein [unclassified Roseateles]